MKDLFAAIREKTRAGEDTVLATVVAEIGSSPRSAGSHMAVASSGRIFGTIGGGMVEYKSIQFAQDILKKRQSECKTYHLYSNDEEELGMLCGGDIDVYFQFIKGGDQKTISFIDECLLLLERDEDQWLFIDLTDPGDWAMAMYGANIPLKGMELSDDDIKPLLRNNGIMKKIGSRRVYSEPVNFAGKVYIFGGGHCSQALVPVLNSVDFRCVVFDNREEYVSPDVFPQAHGLIFGDYRQIDRHIHITPSDYIVIMTHAWDVAVLRQTVSANCQYIGVIGSKTKVAAVKDMLASEGVGGEFLDRLNAPIGTRIRSETPEEIAVSIAGEMILRRAENRAAAVMNRSTVETEKTNEIN
jgi:xanthine dehydrogenase accessory factor